MTKAKYSLSLKEAMTVLQIINVHKTVELSKPAKKQSKEEIQLFDELTSIMLSGYNDGETLTYEISLKNAFGIWLMIDTYKQYLTEMNAATDLEQVESLLHKLGAK